MGKLAIISDLHIDINKLGQAELAELVRVLKEAEVTHLHLAGDTANTVNGLLETVRFLEQTGLSVTYNFGNHELPSIKAAAEMEEYPEEHFLNQKVLELNGQLVLLGVNGWYDYSYSVEPDQQKILASKNLYWYDRFIERGKSDPEINQEILDQLASVLDELARQKKQVIIATHFVPRREFILYQEGKYARWNQLNAFLGSEKTGELFSQYSNIKQVVFGHTHRRFGDQVIGEITYSARPFGYFYEWFLTREFMLSRKLMTSFNPMKVRSVLKDRQEEFFTFRNQQLAEEFRRSLTLIEY